MVEGDDRSLWGVFRDRMAAEDIRACYAEAMEVALAVGRGTTPGTVGDEWTGRRLKALYLVCVYLTGGPDGTGPIPAGIDREVLGGLRVRLSQRVSDAATEDDITQADLPALQALATVDLDCADAVKLLVSAQASDAVVGRLAAAADHYRRVFEQESGHGVMSPAGLRLLAWKAANATDWLAQAYYLRREFQSAWTCYDAAARLYLSAADEVHVERCRDKMLECDEQRAPDADALLASLTQRLDTVSAGTLAHAALVAALAELCAAQSDAYGAKQWCAKAIGELAGLGFPAPETLPVEPVVARWCRAMPAGEPGSNRFFAGLGRVVAIHSTLASVRQVLEADRALLHEQVVVGLAEIMDEVPRQIRAVGAVLDRQLSGFPVPGFSPDTTESLAVGVEAETNRRRFLDVMRGINRVQDNLYAVMTGTMEAQEAVAFAERVVARTRPLGNPVSTAQALNSLGMTLRAANRLEEAATPLEEAYRLVSVLAGAGERDVAIMALSVLCSVYAGLGNWKQLSAVAGDAIEAVERDRYRVNAPYLQASYLSGYLDVFVAGIFGAWKLGDYDSMLRRTELAKGHAGLRALAGAPGPDDEVTAEIRALSDAIDSGRGSQDPEVAGLEERRRRLWDLRAARHRDLLGRLPDFSLAAAQAALAPDEGALYYFWLSDSVLLVTTVTPAGVEVERRILTDEQSGRLADFTAEIGSLKGTNLGLDATFISPSADVLLPDAGLPLLDPVKRLIISPHRRLHWFPFHALPFGGSPLALRFAVRYAPNLTSLLLMRRTAAAADARPLFAGLSVTHFPPADPRLDDLVGVEEEIEEVAAAYRAHRVEARTLQHTTRQQLQGWHSDGTLQRASVLHISTHGSPLAQAAPMEAYFHLADGRVDGLEIGLWDLQSETVVLGSCDSGQMAVTDREGGTLAGDEMFGLPAALLAAGARSVLAATWPVDNETAKAFVPAWHRHVLEGHPADVALHLTQKEFLANATIKQRRAYYWAPYFLISIGRPESVIEAGDGSRPG